MPRPRKATPLVEGAEKAAAVLTGFDYHVHEEDFVLYELHRLIDENRASFDDCEFRALIDEGIRAHIEENLEVRAQLAGILRATELTGEARAVTSRIVSALENIQTDLCNVAVLVRNYTEYLLSRLEGLPEDSTDDEIIAAADRLFESGGDRSAAETALAVLCEHPSPVTVRVLAHAVAEPLLDEDIEARAFTALKSVWPLPRHYMLYNLQGHTHEDIPIRWFQLFVEVDELTTVELVLEELRAHSDAPASHEDLVALMNVLHGCRDPEMEDKILSVLNTPSTGRNALSLLQTFLEEHRPVESPGPSPWTRHGENLKINARYLQAAAMFERGKRAEALQALDRILDARPGYPFAVMLKGKILSNRCRT